MIDFKNPEIQAALTEAFRLGYMQGAEDASGPYPRVDEDREMLSFKLKLEESVEFQEAVQKDFASREIEKLLIGENDETRT